MEKSRGVEMGKDGGRKGSVGGCRKGGGRDGEGGMEGGVGGRMQEEG